MDPKKTAAAVVAGILVVGGATAMLLEDRKQERKEIGTFAQVAEDGTVVDVIVANQEFIDSGAAGDPAQWIRTYPDEKKRKNYAGKGHKYDPELDAFIAPKPKRDAVLDPKTADWEETDPAPSSASTTNRL